MKVPKIFKRGEEPKKTRVEQLERLGISIQRSDELEVRLQKLKKLESLMREKLEDKERKEGVEFTNDEKVRLLWEKNHTIDSLMREASVPWGRAGDNKWYSEAMLGWELLHAYGKVMVRSVKKILETKETPLFIDKADILDNLEDFLIIEVWLYALLITDISYYEKDVGPSYLITLQQFVGGGPAGPATIPSDLGFPEAPK